MPFRLTSVWVFVLPAQSSAIMVFVLYPCNVSQPMRRQAPNQSLEPTAGRCTEKMKAAVDSRPKKQQAKKQKKSNTLTIGLDFGDRRPRFCVLGAAGEVIEEGTLRYDRVSLGQLVERFEGAMAVLETGCHSPWISRFLEQVGCRVLIANPRKWTVLPKPSPNGSTTQPPAKKGKINFILPLNAFSWKTMQPTAEVN